MSNDLQVMEFDAAKLDLIKRTVAKGATQDEFELFLHACKRTGLDPLMKQIHAIKRWSATDQREIMAIQTGIDGYRLIAERTGKYSGSDEPVFENYAVAGYPAKATVTVWKLVDGQRCAFTASARWEEYVQKKKDGTVTSFWQRMPYGQLAKCAEALALRKAFPAELSGVYTHEEMAQADNPIQVTRPTIEIPQVRPRNDATMVRPTTDHYTGEPIGQEDGAGPDAGTRSIPARHDDQQASDAPASLTPAEFCRQQAEQAPEHVVDTPKFTFGKHKGKLVNDPSIPDDYLSWIEGSLKEQITDPKYARYREEKQRLLDAIRGELIERNAMPME